MSLLLLFRPSASEAAVVVVGRFDPGAPGGDHGPGTPTGTMTDPGAPGGDHGPGSPTAGMFDPHNPRQV